MMPLSASEFSEEKVKAALLYSISKFTTWPASSFESDTAPLTICVVSQPFDHLQKKKSKGRSIRVISVLSAPIAKQGCHILFVPKSAQSSWRNQLKFVQGQPILLASDIPDFSNDGGMVEFKLVGKSMKILINTAAVMDSGITLSARLLKLATIVKTSK